MQVEERAYGDMSVPCFCLAFNVISHAPAAVNPGQTVKTWSHAINPTEHILQSYQGHDL